MHIIKSAYSFSEIGLKDNQEDRVYPRPGDVKPGQRYFILCDGMGGHDNGEVASEAVSTALGYYFDSHPVEAADEEYFNAALSFAYDRLDACDTGGEKKMGTTLTCLFFNPDGYLAAHIGDSRIYQFRDGKIIFRTRDHSLVNDLLKAGEITEEQAVNYPRKNVITRAMQPNTRRSKADIHISRDLRPGDYFFMCCDGVLEKMTDGSLENVFSGPTSPFVKLTAIKSECGKGTKDNYTCWLIPVSDSAEKSGVEMKGGFKKIVFALCAFAIVFCVVLWQTGKFSFGDGSFTETGNDSFVSTEQACGEPYSNQEQPSEEECETTVIDSPDTLKGKQDVLDDPEGVPAAVPQDEQQMTTDNNKKIKI